MANIKYIFTVIFSPCWPRPIGSKSHNFYDFPTVKANVTIYISFLFSLGVKNGIKGYADAIVQAACAAVSSEGFISAIRRTCSNDSPSCEQVCMDATSQMKSKVSNQGGKQLSINQKTETKW